MQRVIRRKFILALLCAGAGVGALRSVWARPENAGAASEQPHRLASIEPDAAMQTLANEAARWIARMRLQGRVILPFPISSMQREFRIGYSRTCAIAQLLEEAGHWTIAYSDDGLRYARLHPAAQR